MNKYIGLGLGAVVVVAAPFFVPGPGGKPLANLDFVKQQFDKGLEPINDMGSAIKDAIPQDSSTDKTPSVYKWQDANGNWHYGDKQTAGAEEMDISTDLNIVDLPEAKPAARLSSGSNVTIIEDSSLSNPLKVVKEAAAAPEKIKEYEASAFEREKALKEVLQN